ncbi:MAG TPA: DoxX family membrane protein [Kineosporiaceae bacterium]|nr:DoxX family membrane protein [Kineosporiaceae bacterium]
MTLVRRIARPLLAASFVQEGLEAVLHPGRRAEQARPLVEAVARPLGLPEDAELFIRANGAVMLGAGALFALGRMPRITGLALAASLAPGIYLQVMSVRMEKDVDRRTAELDDLMGDLSRFGGALLAAVDTEGRPGLAWRGRHAAEHLGARAQQTTRRARKEARRAAMEARRSAKQARRGAGTD